MSVGLKTRWRSLRSQRAKRAGVALLRRGGTGRRIFARLAVCVVGLAVVGGAGGAIIIKRTVDAMGPVSIERGHNLSRVVLDRNGKLLRAYTTDTGRWRLPATRKDVDPIYLAMLLAYEDRRFYSHSGVDPLSVARAGWQLVHNGRIVSGASTLTMQVARLLEAKHERTAGGKLRQMIRAVQLERLLTKEEILDHYLKLAPFGGNIEGVRAASLAYLGKEPNRLSIAEAALLVALPQSPEARRPDRRRGAAQRARNRVLARMAKAGVIGRREAARARRSRVAGKRRAFPLIAGHLTDARIAARPDLRTHRLTLERGLQRGMENLVTAHAKANGGRLSSAILVADHSNGEVLAYVGSPGYLDQSRFGAIDMVQAVRSPGSTLKPFIYGLGFEAGIVHPETLIEDRPVRFGSYAPENFDNQYRGTVSIREALQRSLNIPAVKVLYRVGPRRLLARFRAADVRVQIPGGGQATLAVGLGGAGLRLSDLATLYTALANGGVARVLRTQMDVKAKPEPTGTRRVMSAPAAWYASNVLAGVSPPKHAKAGQVAFKTGTSYGYRDAWAVGFDGRHVVAVWIGRPDGAATPGLTGIRAAAPLLFDAFQHLGAKRTALAKRPAGTLRARNRNLPPPLRRFRFRAAVEMAHTTPLQIVFPPDAAELDAPAPNAPRPVVLKAQGGLLPLTWLVDGRPIPSPAHRFETTWLPDGPGFARITVIDAAGQARSSAVRFR